MPTTASSSRVSNRSNRKLVNQQQQPRRSKKKTALRLHFSMDSVTETDRPATPRPASRSSVCTLCLFARLRSTEAVTDSYISRLGPDC